MWPFNRKPKYDNRYNHTLTEEDREASIATRQYNAQIRKLKQETKHLQLQKELMYQKAEVDELKDELFGVDEDETIESNNPESLLMGLLTKAFMQKANQTEQTNQTNLTEHGFDNPIDNKIHLTDEEIDNYLQQIPIRYVKRSKTLSDEEIIKLINGRIPNLSDESILRGVARLRVLSGLPPIPNPTQSGPVSQVKKEK